MTRSLVHNILISCMGTGYKTNISSINIDTWVEWQIKYQSLGKKEFLPDESVALK